MRCESTLLAEIESALLKLDANEVAYTSEREKAEAEEGFKESLEFFQAKRRNQPLYFDYAESQSVTRNFNVLLESANELKKDAPVAYHLVGAMLKLRFPGK